MTDMHSAFKSSRSETLDSSPAILAASSAVDDRITIGVEVA
jgi:hypothetical protein